jgi:hypothetical protein
MGYIPLIRSVFLLSALALGLAGCGAAQPEQESAAAEQVEIAAPEPEPAPARKRLAPRLPQLTEAEIDERLQLLLAVDDVELVFGEVIERYMDPQQIPPLLHGGLGFLVHLALGSTLASSCDLHQPMAMAVGGSSAAGDSATLFAIRLVGDPVARLSGAFDLTEVGNGVHLLRPVHRDSLGLLGDRFLCAVADAEGKAPYLVCGFPHVDVPLLAPHVADWVADRTSAPVVALELSSSFLEEVLAKTADRSSPEDANEALGRALALQWFGSLERVVLRGELLANRLAVELALHQRRGDSAIGSLFATSAASDERLPPEFEALPTDTLLALSFTARDGRAVGRLIDLATGAMLESDVGEEREEVAALLEEIEAVATAEKPLRLAYGLDEKRALKRLEKVLKKKKKKIDREQAHAALDGWFAVGISSEVRAWNGLLQRIHDLEQRSRARPNKRGKRGPGSEEPSRTLTKMKLVKVKKKDRLPKGAVYLRIDERPNPEWKPTEPDELPAVASTRHLLSVAGRGTTWLVGAGDRKRAFEIARMLTAGERGVPPGMRQSFRPVGVREASALGFVTPLFFDVVAADADTREELEDAVEDLRENIAQLEGGRTPLPLAVIGEKGAEGQEVLKLSVKLPDRLLRRVFAEATADQDLGGEELQKGFEGGFGPLEK